MPTTMERKRYQLRRKLNYSAIFFYTELCLMYTHARRARCSARILLIAHLRLDRVDYRLHQQCQLRHHFR